MIGRPTRILIAWFVLFLTLSLQISAFDGISLCFFQDCSPDEESTSPPCGCSDACVTDDTSQQSSIDVLRSGRAQHQCVCQFEFPDWAQDEAYSIHIKAVDKAQPDLGGTPIAHPAKASVSFHAPLLGRPFDFPLPNKALASLQTVVLRH